MRSSLDAELGRATANTTELKCSRGGVTEVEDAGARKVESTWRWREEAVGLFMEAVGLFIPVLGGRRVGRGGGANGGEGALPDREAAKPGGCNSHLSFTT